MPKDDDTPTPSGISDFDITTGKPLHPKAYVSPFEQVPDVSGFEVDESPTPITSATDSKQMLLKIGVLVQRQSVHVEEIPAIQKTLTAVVTRQEVMQEAQTEVKERLTRIEQNGHPCQQEQVIAKLQEESKEWRRDKEEGIKTRGMVQSAKRGVAAVEEDIKTVKKNSRGLLVALVMAALGIIVTLVGTSWSLGGRVEGINQRIESEKSLRAEQYDNLEDRLDRLPTKEIVPTKSQVEQLQRVVRQNGHSFEDRCKRLTTAQKQQLARQVHRGVLPHDFLCL